MFIKSGIPSILGSVIRWVEERILKLRLLLTFLLMIQNLINSDTMGPHGMCYVMLYISPTPPPRAQNHFSFKYYMVYVIRYEVS